MINKFILDNLQISLVIAILFTRIIDIVCTYIISPKLLLETNPIVRKVKWPAGILTILLSAIPLININLGIVMFSLSLISSALNMRKLWMMKTIGEKEYLNILIKCLKSNGILKISFFEFLSSLFWILLSLTLILLNNNDSTYVFWFSISLGGYGIISFVYYVNYLLTLKKNYI